MNSNGWWGEGEIKFYLDDDEEYPTICGTGTEDYFGGAWNFDVPGRGYTEFSTPYLGLPQVIRPDGLYAAQQRFGMYRWHVLDPIAFADRLRVDIQALGWRSGRRYLPLRDDIARRRTSTSTGPPRTDRSRRPLMPWRSAEGDVSVIGYLSLGGRVRDCPRSTGPTSGCSRIWRCGGLQADIPAVVRFWRPASRFVAPSRWALERDLGHSLTTTWRS